MKFLLFFLNIFFITLSCQSNNLTTSYTFGDTADQVKMLPKFGSVKQCQMAGHLPVYTDKNPYEDSANLFYWFVGSEKEPTKDPIILWLNGGPGSSGFYGFFAENGPYVINNGALEERAFSWTKQANYLMIEQAPGVGFSYAAPNFQVANESQVIEMLYHALVAFYKKYPELIHNPLYIGGESYAGKYIPELATKILEKNTSKINLQGIIIVNGWVDPLLQMSMKAEFAYSHGLIDKKISNIVQKKYTDYKKDLLDEKPSAQNINIFCEEVEKIIQDNGGLCKANIRILAEPDYSPITTYLNHADVQKSLHVDSRVKENTLFCENVSQALKYEVKNSVVHLYNSLLENGIKVLIISGLDDGSDCNFMATDLWMTNLVWKESEKFHKAATVLWKTKAQDVAGYIRKADKLTHVKVRGAGHLAPMDQPENVRDVTYQFIFNSP